MRTPIRLVLLTTGLCLLAVGCSRQAEAPPPPVPVTPKAPAPPPPPPPEPRRATAVISGLGDAGVAGEVTFTDTGNGIAIEAHVSGLKQGQKHGFHIHEIGDCSGDGTAAGPHFNPAGAQHAGPDAPMPHAGDLGNLQADGEGHAQITMLSRHVSLAEGETNGILGRSVIVHEGEDDLSSQPAGNAGKRIACGVIQLTSPGSPEADATKPPASDGHAEHAEHAEGGEKP